MSKQKKALVLFSGGQDSATCLAYALKNCDYVETLGFDYGQRHDIEMKCRLNVREELLKAFPEYKDRLGPDHVLELPALGALSDTALTRDKEIEMSDAGLPSTFVPGRNIIFLNYAAVYAWRRGIKELITGICQTDYSGYPDCRDDFAKSMQVTLNLGMEADFRINTPLMWLTKAQTWQMAEELGGKKLVELIRVHTHTCYTGTRDELHDWGMGCGKCPACELRAKGWEEYVKDKAGNI